MTRILIGSIVVCCVVLLPIDNCDAVVRTWDAGGNGFSWEENCNWSGSEGSPECRGFQPFDGDDAVIPFGNPVVTFLEGVAALSLAPAARIDLDSVLGAHNGVTNDGIIDIGVAGGQLNIGVFNPNNTHLQGNGELILTNSSNNPARVQAAEFVSSFVTHAAGHTIRGEGLVNGKWVNDGLIRAEEASGDASALLEINGTMTNNGMIRSSPTGTMLLESTTLTMGATGRLIADTQPIQLTTATIIGGSLDAINGAKFVRRPDVGGTTVFSGATINSDFDVVVNNAGVHGAGTGFTNNGTMTIDNMGVANGELSMAAGSTLDGSGEVILNRANNNTHISGNFTHGADHTIRGAGLIRATIVNNGSIFAEPKNDGALLRVISPAITNNNLLQANSGATLRLEFQVAVTQSETGRIRADDGGRVELRDNATIIGGQLQTAGTGLIVDISSSTLNRVTNEGNFHVQAGSTTRVNTALTNNGTIHVNPTGVAGVTNLEFSNTSLQGSGTIVLNNASITGRSPHETIVQSADHTIRGFGRIANGYFGTGRIVNNGRLEGNSAAEPLRIQTKLSGHGLLKDVQLGGDGFGISHTLGEAETTAVVPVEGMYNFLGGNSMLVDLGGTTPGAGYDQLNSTGPIMLSNSGTRLEAKIVPGFVPAAGDIFNVVTTTDALTGTFGSVILPSLIPHFSLTWSPVQYTDNDVFLEVLSVTPFVADGDFDNDGDYDCADVNALVGDIAIGNNGPLYDLTEDGLVDTDDLTFWLTEAGAANLPLGNPYLPGDATLDGRVGVDDFSIWNTNRFTSVASWCSGDFNADGAVDVLDFNIWNSHKSLSAEATSIVPEPVAGAHLCWILGLAVRQHRRRRTSSRLRNTSNLGSIPIR